MRGEDRIFGWSLPPGCSTLPGENDDWPCEVCELYDEIPVYSKCPAIDPMSKEWEPDFDKCPKVGMVDRCEVCKKPIGKLRADIPKEHVEVEYWSGEPLFLCSEACVQKLREENKKAEEEERRHREEEARREY